MSIVILFFLGTGWLFTILLSACEPLLGVYIGDGVGAVLSILIIAGISLVVLAF